MKKDFILQIPDGYNEYRLVLLPGFHVQEQVSEIKKELRQLCKMPEPKFLPAQIRLVDFIQAKEAEKHLITRLKGITMVYSPFKIALNGFGSLPSHSIFINVQSKQQVHNLLNHLKPAQKWMTFEKENQPHFLDDPYILVAGNLLPWQYETAWIKYQHQYFSANFFVEKLVLMKRRNGNETYRQLAQFEFLNLPVRVEQGKLFS